MRLYAKYRDEAAPFSRIADEIGHKYWPNESKEQIRTRVKNYIRRHKGEVDQEKAYNNVTVEYRADGSTVYDRLIEIYDDHELVPEDMLKYHRLDEKRWQIVSYKNNYWHSQMAGGKRLLMCQSKITVKPIADNDISFAEVKEWFTRFEKTYEPPKVNIIIPTGSQLLETNIADLHLGKLAWRGETEEDYDWKIASERFKYAINDIVSRIDRQRVERINFPIGKDFFNSDTESGATTKGTQQCNDIRWRKMFIKGIELYTYGIDVLSQVAPVDAFYVPGNHDKMAAFYVACALAAHFSKYSNVSIDTEGTPRKYREYYNTLTGFSHGDEDKPRIMKLMQVEAREAWGRTLFHEMHTDHIHSENVKEDGGLIWRTVSSMTGTDEWHKEAGYVGAVRKSQNFIYDRQKGLIEVINTVI
jgi:hypothetical protein